MMVESRFVLYILLSFLFSLAYSFPAANHKRNQEHSFENSIDADNLVEHLKEFQEFATENGGNRVVGTKGHQDTLDYIVEYVKEFGYQPQLQEINFIRNITIEHSLTTIINNKQQTFEVKPIPGSPSTSKDGISATLVIVENPCGPINVDTQHQQQPWVALIQRGQCSLMEKAELAQQSGATAVIIYRTDNMAPPHDDSIDTFTSTIPTGILSTKSTNTLLATLKQTPSFIAQLRMVINKVPVTTYNIIAETKVGNKSNVVMIGAHTDSVQDGPGINDDGSGVSALLELARHLDQTKVINTVRFCWWTAEEEGLIGSTAYVNSLTEQQKRTISLYLNADMIASPNYVNMVYEGNESSPPPGFSAAPRGSKAIQLAFEHYFDEMKEYHETIGYDIVASESDAVPFYKASIPSGGLSTGFIYLKTKEECDKYGGHEGVAHDPCYHSSCDTINNINTDGFVMQTRAYAHVLEMYSQSTASLLDPTPNQL